MPLFHLRYDLRCLPGGGSDHVSLYRAALEQCEWADRLGFASVTLSEHHGSDDGYLPSPLVMGAAVAARTRTIRILLGAIIAPLYDPLRLAEDLAVLDLLSEGRVIPVLSGGYVATEFAAFGKRLGGRKQFMEEICPLLRQAWTGEVFPYGSGTVRVRPVPASKHPLIFMGGSSDAAARRAARHADYFVPTEPRFFEAYREELRRLGKADPGPQPRMTGNFLHISENPDADWQRIAPFLLHETNAYAQWAEAAGVATPYRACGTADGLRATGRYPVLRPDQLLELMATLEPFDGVMFHPLAGGIPPEIAWESLRLFETRVLPEMADSAAGRSA